MWKDISGFEKLYQVSDKGEVKSLEKQVGFYKRKEIILSQKTNEFGYKVLRLWKNNIAKDCIVHRLVAQAFIENPLNAPQVNHKDGNKKNNSVENLEWCTSSENIKHSYAIGLVSHVGEKHNGAKLTEKNVLYIRSSKERICDLARKFKVSPANIIRVKRRLSWTHI